jgi:hypothetical protein
MLAGGALWLPKSLSMDSQRSIDSQSELTVNLNIISIDSQSQKMGPARAAWNGMGNAITTCHCPLCASQHSVQSL